MRNFMKTMFLKQREKFDQETRVRNANFQIPDDIKLVENIPYLNDSCPAHTIVAQLSRQKSKIFIMN